METRKDFFFISLSRCVLCVTPDEIVSSFPFVFSFSSFNHFLELPEKKKRTHVKMMGSIGKFGVSDFMAEVLRLEGLSHESISWLWIMNNEWLSPSQCPRTSNKKNQNRKCPTWKKQSPAGIKIINDLFDQFAATDRSLGNHNQSLTPDKANKKKLHFSFVWRFFVAKEKRADRVKVEKKLFANEQKIFKSADGASKLETLLGACYSFLLVYSCFPPIHGESDCRGIKSDFVK